jgi:hypothetical protein
MLNQFHQYGRYANLTAIMQQTVMTISAAVSPIPLFCKHVTGGLSIRI